MTAEACLAEHRAEGIGTYKERSQHYILKNYFEPDADLHEIPVCGFVADIKRDREIIEIQTSGFSAMRRKLEAFSNEGYDVTVVYPVAAAQRVVWIDPETGEGKSGNTTRRQKNIFKLLPQLLYTYELFEKGAFRVLAVMLVSDSIRVLDGRGKGRKIGATKLDTVPTELIDTATVENAADVFRLLPFYDGEMLKSAEISKRLGLIRRNLSAAIKLLVLLKILTPCKKEGNSIIYKVSKP